MDPQISIRISQYRYYAVTGYQLHRENRENGPKNPCQGKRREFGNFVKTQEIWFAQVVNSLILKVKDILKNAAKISKNLLNLDKPAKSVLCML